MLKIKINQSIQKIILFLLIATPVFTFGEWTALISNMYKSNLEVSTPLAIKIIKDIGLLLIIFLVFFKKKSQVLKHITIIFVLSSLFIFFIFLISCTNNGFLLAAAGIRWLLPLITAFFLINSVDTLFMNRVSIVIAYVFIFSFLLQIYQIFQGANFHGRIIFGLVRVPGAFAIPSTSGIFSCIVLFYAIYYMRKSKLRILLFYFTPISILLSASGTAVLIYLAMNFIRLFPKIFGKINYYFIFMMAGIIVIFSLPYLTSITGRSDIIEMSGNIRIKILMNTLRNFEWISSKFGVATNSAVLLRESLLNNQNSMISDSTYTAILVNLGLIGLIGFIIIYYIWFLYANNYKKQDIIVFTMIYTLAGVSTQITESYPINLLLAVLLAYFLQPRKKYQVLRSKSSQV